MYCYYYTRNYFNIPGNPSIYQELLEIYQASFNIPGESFNILGESFNIPGTTSIYQGVTPGMTPWYIEVTLVTC